MEKFGLRIDTAVWVEDDSQGLPRAWNQANGELGIVSVDRFNANQDRIAVPS